MLYNFHESFLQWISQGDTWWAASDLGWVVGHEYICYSPLLNGCTSVLYEGKPVGTPDAGQFFRFVKQTFFHSYLVFSLKLVFNGINGKRECRRKRNNFRKRSLTHTRCIVCCLLTSKYSKNTQKNTGIHSMNHYLFTNILYSLHQCIFAGSWQKIKSKDFSLLQRPYVQLKWQIRRVLKATNTTQEGKYVRQKGFVT